MVVISVIFKGFSRGAATFLDTLPAISRSVAIHRDIPPKANVISSDDRDGQEESP
jgi:hypothetical protein